MAIVFRDSGALSAAIGSVGESVGKALTEASKKRTKATKMSAYRDRVAKAKKEGKSPLDHFIEETEAGTLPEEVQKSQQALYAPELKTRAEAKATKELLVSLGIVKDDEAPPPDQTQPVQPQPVQPQDGQPIPSQPVPDQPVSGQEGVFTTDDMPGLAPKGTPERRKQEFSIATATDNQVAGLLANKDTEKIGKMILDQRLNAQKIANENKLYARESNKDWKKKMSQLAEETLDADWWHDKMEYAILTGDQSFFSQDNFYNLTGLTYYITATGKLFDSAGKHLLVGGFKNIPAKGINMYVEKVVARSIPQMGASKEANLTAHAAMVGSNQIKKDILKAGLEVRKEDMEKYGYEKPGWEERARERALPLIKETYDKTAYKLRQLEETEKTIGKLVDKKVIKGTFLTKKMGKAIVGKFDGDQDKALKYAEKMGYTITSNEQLDRWL